MFSRSHKLINIILIYPIYYKLTLGGILLEKKHCPGWHIKSAFLEKTNFIIISDILLYAKRDLKPNSNGLKATKLGVFNKKKTSVKDLYMVLLIYCAFF